MSRKPYAQMKDSGVEWLGEIPAHWDISRIRRLFQIEKRIAGEEGYDVLSITQRGIKVRDVDSNDGQLSMDYAKYQFVYPGDFAMNHMDLLTGYIDIADRLGVTSPDYRVFKLIDDTHSFRMYYLYIFQLCYNFRIFYPLGQGSSQLGRWRLPTNAFNDFALPRPPLPEQVAIAAFLDRETAKIDALVAEQERLIALLAEKRRAVISHAVTKGLDPNAPMKNSGIEWLGEVPAHWEFLRLKDICQEIVDCKNRTPDEAEAERFFVARTSCIKNGKFDPSSGYYTDEDSFAEWTRKGLPRDGDILFTREAPTGEACLFPQGYELCLGQRMMYLRPNLTKVYSEFLLATIYGPLVRAQVEAKSKGSTVGHLRVGEIGELPCLLPPLNEQRQIFSALDRTERQFEKLIGSCEDAIALLKERRAALISAAVTGKIDVRDAVRAEEVAA